MNEPTPTPGDPPAKKQSGGPLIILSIILIGALLAGVYYWRTRSQNGAATDVPATVTHPGGLSTVDKDGDGKMLPTPVSTEPNSFSSIPAAIVQSPVPARGSLDFDRLFAVSPPVHDYFVAAEELGRADFGRRAVTTTPYQLGDRAMFNTNDGQRQAELVYMDELAAYWVETGLALDQDELIAAAGRLRERYYPMLSRNIGREWRPGVDGDPRFTVLHILEAPDTYELGYFTDENQYSRSVFPQSNQREMIYLNMAQLEQGVLYDGTLVHEVQHLIQWNLDANEDKWFNEGLSQIVETMAGLPTVDPQPYLEQTHIRLDRWSDDSPAIHAHYAASYLYLLYFWEQLGDVALTELARHPANGLSAVRAVLAGHRPEQSLESFTADWATALYLDGDAAGPRATINAHDLPRPFLANRVRQLPFTAESTLGQYAIDYIDLDFSGPATITFAGDSVVQLIDPPPNGGQFWYAPPANSSRSQLTALVDLAGLTSATLSFATWYDLEPTYDFTYLSLSIDGGRSWRPLRPTHELLGAYGPAWGGRSNVIAGHENGWLEETVSLDTYLNRKVLLRFDVVTDFEEFGRGFALSNLHIPELAVQPVWVADGFVETGHLLPQEWQVRLIREGISNEIIPLQLDDLNRVQTTVDLGSDGGVLVIIPLTPFVESTARYWLSIESQ